MVYSSSCCGLLAGGHICKLYFNFPFKRLVALIKCCCCDLLFTVTLLHMFVFYFSISANNSIPFMYVCMHLKLQMQCFYWKVSEVFVYSLFVTDFASCDLFVVLEVRIVGLEIRKASFDTRKWDQVYSKEDYITI